MTRPPLHRGATYIVLPHRDLSPSVVPEGETNSVEGSYQIVIESLSDHDKGRALRRAGTYHLQQHDMLVRYQYVHRTLVNSRCDSKKANPCSTSPNQP